MEGRFQCAGCGEWNEMTVDESAGKFQEYVEDCQVCCRTNVLSIRLNSDVEEVSVEAELE
jgi:Cysteine-rich CPXCG